ncbi:MAG: hypothetical protein EPN33_03360 [Acidobacteria bacterium]|nr:MAG: hypothetical protein EPN33_03360 [Acidobacteriota bacterium]
MSKASHLWRRIGIFAAIVVGLAILAVWLVLRSSGFQRYVVQKVEGSASQALGTPVHVDQFRLQVHSFTPSVDFYGLVVEGKPVAGVGSQQPLVLIPHLHVAVKVTSILHWTFQIEDVELDRPVVHVYVNAQGDSNLPPGGGARGQRSESDVFALGIGRAEMRDGQVYVNDREQKIDAEVRGLELALGYVPKTQSYTGKVSYTAGSVQVAGMPTITSGMAMQFTASRNGVQIPSLTLTADGVKVSAQATLTGYAEPRLAAAYRVQADLGRLRKALREPALPAGQAEMVGQAKYANNEFSTEGRFSSAAMELRLAGLAAPVRHLSGAYQFAHGKLQVSQMRAEVMGGRLQAGASVENFAAPRLQASAQLQDAQLGRMARLAPNSQATLQALGLTGKVGVKVEARGAVAKLHIAAQTTMTAMFGPTSVEGNAQVAYANDRLTIQSGRLRTPHAEVRVTGGLSTRASGAAQLEVQAQASDFAEVESLAGRAAGALGKPLPTLGLQGSGSLHAQVVGTLAAPVIDGQFRAVRLGLRGTHWNSLKGSFAASGAEVALRDVELRAPKGAIKLSGSLALEHWKATAASVMTAALTVNSLPVSQVAGAVPGKLPLEGIVDAQAAVNGTLDSPVGQGTATVRSARLVVNGKHAGVESARLNFQAAGGTITAQLAAQLEAGEIKASGTWKPASGDYSAQLSAPGLELAKIPPLAATHLGIHGLLALEGQGQGKITAPVFDLKLRAKALVTDGQTVQDLSADLALLGQQLRATLTATTLQTTLHAQATIRLEGNWPATASLDAPAIPLAPVLAAFAPQVGSAIVGQTAVQLTLSGPVRAPEQLQVDVTVPKLEMRYEKALELHAAAPMEAHLAHGVVQLAPAHFSGSGTELQVQGTVPIPALGASASAAMNLAVAGNVNLKLVQAFVPDLVAGGNVNLQLHGAGTLARPNLTGTIAVSGVSLNDPGWPVALQGGEGALRLHDGRLDLTGFSANVGSGRVTVGGGMALLPKMQFNFAVAAEQVSVRYPPGLREVIGANVNVTGSPAAALVAGRVRVESVSPAPGFDFATLTSQLAQQTVAVATPGDFLTNLRLELTVSTPNEINVVSRDFSIHANANVNVRGTGREPVVLGRLDLTSGDLIFRGNRYVIQAGTLDFVNPIRTVPSVNITADTTIQQYDLHLHFQGPMDNMRTSYTSDPALPPADIISLLAFGTTTEASGANPLPGNLGAENLVASAVTSQITDRVEKIAGISHLSVDPVLGGGQQNASARITLQQRVTANLYVTISTDVTGTQRNVIEVQYRLSPRVSVSGVRKQNGGFGANLQFKKTWH